MPIPSTRNFLPRPAAVRPSTISWNNRNASQYNPFGSGTGVFGNRRNSSSPMRPSATVPNMTRPLSAPISTAR